MIPIASPIIENDEIQEVVNVLRSGFLAQGPKVEEFEKAFANYTNSRHAVATSSGTSALHVALSAAGVGKGDEVITTPFSFAATSNAALYVGARPVFIDINPLTYNIDPERIEDAITRDTRAIIAVHLYGQPAEMDHIKDIGEDHGLIVIEDAAQAHGALYHGKKVGSLGDIGCFSFYPTKNITTGEGGMITTDDEDIAHLARMIRSHGESERYEHVILGYNFRMTDMAAAIGIVQLKKLDKFNNKRIENAEYLTENLKALDHIKTPYIMDGVKHVFHQYTVRVENREKWIEHLQGEGIGVGVHYPRPIYRQPLYEDLGLVADCPEAEKASREVLSLPVHPRLTMGDLDMIIDAVENFPG
ncbi:MAG: DegT/DnrJ/EryC1/StrS family aminotransferase [Methanothermobacter tenebrarum]